MKHINYTEDSLSSIPFSTWVKWGLIWVLLIFAIYFIFKLNDQGKTEYFGEGNVIECISNPARYVDDSKRYKNIVLIDGKGNISTFAQSCLKNTWVTVEKKTGYLFKNIIYESKKT